MITALNSRVALRLNAKKKFEYCCHFVMPSPRGALGGPAYAHELMNQDRVSSSTEEHRLSLMFV